LPKSGGCLKKSIYVAVSSLKTAKSENTIMTEKENELLNKKVSIKSCREILYKDGNEYSEEELIEIRNYLFELAQIDYEVFIHNQNKEREFELKKENVIQLEITENENLKNAA
jgi:hypothetical protein